jgi:ABC-type bacteriocin/lantibiotic exporter with double-glycine peptidase domain
MDTAQIDRIVVKLAELVKQNFNYFDFREHYEENITYAPQELGKYIDHMVERGMHINLSVLRHHISREYFNTFIQDSHFPILVFHRCPQSQKVEPVVIFNDYNKKIYCYNFESDQELGEAEIRRILPNLVVHENAADVRKNGKIIFLTVFPLKYNVSDYYSAHDNTEELTPLVRLLRLLRGESKDIGYIYVYAFLIGIVNLSLPLGIQATIGMISGGMIFSSVVVLIALVIIGTLISGGLQIMQLALVEVLQQRVFAKGSYEIAFRLPRIKTEALFKYYPPELVNRYFDVVNLQKSLPKLLIDITGAALQIFFGLLLLSLYHPLFLAFAFTVVLTLVLIFYVTSPKGLETKIIESKYKYKIAHWLEEVARTVDAFKMAGSTNLPIEKSDELINGYLYYRKTYFRVIISQMSYMVVFKTAITGAVLVLGSILVVDRQISLGQFVASEIIIVLVISAVEKLVGSIDTVYETLTSVDKIAHITDLPLEKKQGVHASLRKYPQGVHLATQNLSYKYPENNEYTIKDITMEVMPGESICFAGSNDSGKHTLVKVLVGGLSGYDGVITYNHMSVRNINSYTLRDNVSQHILHDEIFYGTILENITMGRSQVTYQDVLWAIENVGLSHYVNSLKDGLYTVIGASGKRVSGSLTAKILLARAIASKPKLLIVNDFSEHISRKDKLKILFFLMDKLNPWTLIIISLEDDPTLLSACDRVFVLNQGQIVMRGDYESLSKDPEFYKHISRPQQEEV